MLLHVFRFEYENFLNVASTPKRFHYTKIDRTPYASHPARLTGKSELEVVEYNGKLRWRKRAGAGRKVGVILNLMRIIIYFVGKKVLHVYIV